MAIADRRADGGLGRCARRADFALPPSLLALDPADEVVLAAGGRERRLRLTEIDDAGARRIKAVATDPGTLRTLDRPAARARPDPDRCRIPAARWSSFADLPLLTGERDRL